MPALYAPCPLCQGALDKDTFGWHLLYLPKVKQCACMIKTFAYHKPSEQGLEKISQLREAFSSLHTVMSKVCPESRELSVALTNLETTAMWAVKSIVYNDSASETEA